MSPPTPGAAIGPESSRINYRAIKLLKNNWVETRIYSLSLKNIRIFSSAFIFFNLYNTIQDQLVEYSNSLVYQHNFYPVYINERADLTFPCNIIVGLHNSLCYYNTAFL